MFASIQGSLVLLALAVMTLAAIWEPRSPVRDAARTPTESRRTPIADRS